MIFTSITEIDGNLSRSIVRFNNYLIDKKKRNKQKFFRREPIKIINVDTKEWVIAYAAGSSGIKGLTLSTIAIDYDTADQLGLNFKEEVNIQVNRASYFDCLKWFTFHPDKNQQIATHFGLVGVAFGFLGLIISLM
ncbi:hypothetical protein EIJ81_00845 (plasmid) [Aliivibrio salmonicida]|uniref:hypothetical protein n=1 Tax=Aliivibrio salmonicida TaxID=40269 RepID=UPI000F6C6B11|nr:hypothetical protein [Aliivibrio salmonicida]AZL83447.1 hypothetical protein EIJ81_00845 [Aliivibrio salmonicida]